MYTSYTPISKVRERRLRLRMTQDELAARSGLHRNTIVKAEAVGAIPSGRTQRLIAQALDGHPDDFWPVPLPRAA